MLRRYGENPKLGGRPEATTHVLTSARHFVHGGV